MDFSYLIIIISTFVLSCFVFLYRKKVAQLENEKETSNKLLIENVKLTESLNYQKSLIESKKHDLVHIQESLKGEFQNMANNVLKESTKELSTQSSNSLEKVIAPLTENIHIFKSRLEQINHQKVKDNELLKSELKNFKELNQKIIGQTDSLTQALTGNRKSQGDWGEVTLKRILEHSGLREGHEFIYQSLGLGLVNENGNQRRPDVLINLPDDKYLIVDSKVSLSSYVRLIESKDNESLQIAKSDLLKAVKDHIDDLSQKSYEKIKKLNSPEFIFMFFPFEGALSYIADEPVKGSPNINFLEYAWMKRIVICTPTSLYSNLKTVSILWSYAKQEKNIDEIFDIASKVYDRFSELSNHIISVKSKLDKTNKEVNESLDILFNKGKNISNNLEKLKSKGVEHKVKKQINEELLHGQLK